MVHSGPFSWSTVSEPDRWRSALADLERGEPRPWRECLGRLASDSPLRDLWFAWEDRCPLELERYARRWDPQSRLWLLPMLWSQTDLALWEWRWSEAERHAKRAIARCQEAGLGDDSLELSLSYLALARVLAGQGRLEAATGLLRSAGDSHLEVGPLRAELLAELEADWGSRSAVASAADEHFHAQRWERASEGYDQAAALAERFAEPTPRARRWPCFEELAWFWPLIESSRSRAQRVEDYLYFQGQLARCARALGRADVARSAAGRAKAVRATQGEARLALLGGAGLEETAAVRLRLRAPGRTPIYVLWDSARGDRERIHSELPAGRVLLVGGGDVTREFIREFFAAPLPEGEIELQLFGRRARSGQIDSLLYTIWVGFSWGPPLCLPVYSGQRT